MRAYLDAVKDSTKFNFLEIGRCKVRSLVCVCVCVCVFVFVCVDYSFWGLIVAHYILFFVREFHTCPDGLFVPVCPNDSCC